MGLQPHVEARLEWTSNDLYVNFQPPSAIMLHSALCYSMPSLVSSLAFPNKQRVASWHQRKLCGITGARLQLSPRHQARRRPRHSTHLPPYNATIVHSTLTVEADKAPVEALVLDST